MYWSPVIGNRRRSQEAVPLLKQFWISSSCVLATRLSRISRREGRPNGEFGGRLLELRLYSVEESRRETGNQQRSEFTARRIPVPSRFGNEVGAR